MLTLPLSADTAVALQVKSRLTSYPVSFHTRKLLDPSRGRLTQVGDARATAAVSLLTIARCAYSEHHRLQVQLRANCFCFLCCYSRDVGAVGLVTSALCAARRFKSVDAAVPKLEEEMVEMISHVPRSASTCQSHSPRKLANVFPQSISARIVAQIVDGPAPQVEDCGHQESFCHGKCGLSGSRRFGWCPCRSASRSWTIFQCLSGSGRSMSSDAVARRSAYDT